MISGWPCPTVAAPGSTPHDVTEYAVACDRGRTVRLLIVPALFDEHNRLRRFTVEVVRALDRAGIDSILPDLPGTNESLAPLDCQTLVGWREAMAAAGRHFRATHMLTIRGGALAAPDWPGWSYAPVTGSALLRQMIRARLLAAREAGREEQHDSLVALGLRAGLELAGYSLGADMVEQLTAAQPGARLQVISQADIGGPGLWLRAEPGENAEQSSALAARIAAELLA